MNELDEKLFKAVKNGNLDEVKTLLDQGANIEAKDKDGWTPLHEAALNGHTDVAKLLIEKGADIEAKNVDGSTLLHSAVWSVQSDFAKLLIEKGADIEARNEYGYTPLLYAAANGQTDVAEFLIEKGANIEAKGFKDCIPLHYAAEHGQTDVAKLLIGKGADIEAKNDDGWTPLHYAAEHGQTDVAKLLIGKGADIEAKNDDGWTPLHYAAVHGQSDVAKLLIERGADIEAKNEYGRTPLHYAAEYGHADVVKLLIEHGADPTGIDLSDFSKSAALDFQREKLTDLCMYGIVDGFTQKEWDNLTFGQAQKYLGQAQDTLNCKLISAAGAGDLSKADDMIALGANNQTEALGKAVESSQKDMASFLLDHKADIYAADVLSVSVGKGNPEMTNLLLDRGAAVKPEMLHSAVEKGYTQISKALVEHGADVNYVDANKKSILDLAKDAGNSELVSYLEDKGAVSRVAETRNIVSDLTRCPEGEASSPATDLQRQSLRKLCVSGETPSFSMSEWKNLTRGQACERLAAIPDERLKEVKDSLAPKPEKAPVADKGMEI